MIDGVTHVIDSDGHVMEPGDLWQRYLPPGMRERGPRLADDDRVVMTIDGVEVPRRDRIATRTGEALQALGDDRFADGASHGFDPASQVRSMDEEGIDLAVLFPSRGLAVMGVDGLDRELTTACARAYNEWLADFCEDGAGRLFGVGMLDPRNVDAAVVEAERCVTELGFVALFLRPNPIDGQPWHASRFEPLWEAIAGLDVPICFHEGTAVLLPQVGVDRFEEHGLWHVCSHPMEQQLAMVSMVLGGVFARHPGLRGGFMECGAGWLPYWMWRMDEAFEQDGWRDCPDLETTPSDYVRRQGWVGADSDEDPAMYTLEQLGGENVFWGSDYPHPDSKYPEALKTLRALPSMTDDLLRKVLWETPRSFFGDRLRLAADARIGSESS